MSMSLKSAAIVRAAAIVAAFLIGGRYTAVGVSRGSEIVSRGVV
jgi:hypothetical protein